MPRVRADEITEGDLYVYRPALTRGIRRTAVVVAVGRTTEKSPGGATITRIQINADGLLPMSLAPHSKHDIRRQAKTERQGPPA